MKTFKGSVRNAYLVTTASRNWYFSNAKDAVKQAKRSGSYRLYRRNYWNEWVYVSADELKRMVEAGHMPKAFKALI